MVMNMKKTRSGFVKVSFRIPATYLEMIEKLVKRNEFPTRAEAIRYAISMLISHYRAVIR